MYKSTSKRNAGFTLVELAIVIVIIGLIIGGIMSGVSMIRSSKVQTIVSEIIKFQNALKSFETQYEALPGDIAVATSFWAGTANGDGNGQLVWNTEGFRAWQHLELATLLNEGNLSGAVDGSGGATIGTNVPGSEITNGGFSFDTYGALYSKSSNYIIFGAPHTANNLDYSIVLPKEAQTIDEKMDDGKAAYGIVVATEGADVIAGTCIVSNAYYLAGTSTACRVYFRIE